MGNFDLAYSVVWSDEDREYIGLVEEFPLLSCLEATQEEALAGIKRLTALALETIDSKPETTG